MFGTQQNLQRLNNCLHYKIRSSPEFWKQNCETEWHWKHHCTYRSEIFKKKYLKNNCLDVHLNYNSIWNQAEE